MFLTVKEMDDPTRKASVMLSLLVSVTKSNQSELFLCKSNVACDVDVDVTRGIPLRSDSDVTHPSGFFSLHSYCMSSNKPASNGPATCHSLACVTCVTCVLGVQGVDVTVHSN